MSIEIQSDSVPYTNSYGFFECADLPTVYTPVCDICSATLPAEYSFEDAVGSKKAHGWRSVCDLNGDWWDLCPDCYHKHASSLMGIGPSEFGGLT